MIYVLDIDDTLYLEYDYIVSGFSFLDKWCEKNIKKTGFLKKALFYFNEGIKFKIFDFVLKDFGIYDKKLINKLVDYYRKHNPNIELFDDALRFLQSKKKNEVAIITDGNKFSQKNKVYALGLKKYVSQIIITDAIGKDWWKPSTFAYEKIQGRLSSEKCIYVGDNPHKDFIAPKKLCWQNSIRIRRKKSLHYDIKTPKNCIEVKNFDDIENLFKK